MSQMSVVLALLREAGLKGVSNHDLVYRFGITRAADIVYTLRRPPHNLDIETIDEGPTEDGRQKLCRYVLRSGYRQPVQRPVEEPQTLPEPAPLRLPCGCVRSADGRSWDSRCDGHTVNERRVAW